MAAQRLSPTDPHVICCQHCYVAYDIRDGKQCVHDVQDASPVAPSYGISARRAAYVGFCDGLCRTTRTKGARVGQCVDNMKGLAQ